MGIASTYSRAAAIKYRTSYLKRMRYWRGHGIHSPFVYNMVRKIFMTRKIIDSNSLIAQTMLEKKTASRHTAIQIQNLYGYCGYSSYELIGNSQSYGGSEMAVLDKSCSPETIAQIIKQVEGKQHRAVIVIAPHRDKQKHKICEILSNNHKGISIDKFNMLILLFDSRYLKQHYKI